MYIVYSRLLIKKIIVLRYSVGDKVLKKKNSSSSSGMTGIEWNVFCLVYDHWEMIFFSTSVPGTSLFCQSSKISVEWMDGEFCGFAHLLLPVALCSPSPSALC